MLLPCVDDWGCHLRDLVWFPLPTGSVNQTWGAVLCRPSQGPLFLISGAWKQACHGCPSTLANPQCSPFKSQQPPSPISVWTSPVEVPVLLHGGVLLSVSSAKTGTTSCCLRVPHRARHCHTQHAQGGSDAGMVPADWNPMTQVCVASCRSLSHVQRLGDSWPGDSGQPCPGPRWVFPACLT